MVAQVTFGDIPTVAFATGDSCRLWLGHLGLPPNLQLPPLKTQFDLRPPRRGGQRDSNVHAVEKHVVCGKHAEPHRWVSPKRPQFDLEAGATGLEVRPDRPLARRKARTHQELVLFVLSLDRLAAQFQALLQGSTTSPVRPGPAAILETVLNGTASPGEYLYDLILHSSPSWGSAPAFRPGRPGSGKENPRDSGSFPSSSVPNAQSQGWDHSRM